ncbi:hypothetical protein [Christensenella tenuis]|jgi:hypothetical protein|uniref:4Fe-4S Wbl-type domain-containing protein n=1 Tax=Christensenella tenuis TaxID=2763033 RepID=A0ABR7EGG4_9FIRM|nr:hypothetical protein [Christensenella tenuis]MBC5648486.1 hypothetical protein [Christensenella tenuis]
MGYFSNGTEGVLYEEMYCEKCIHYEDCAVLGLHFANNYDEANKKDSFLHELIPYKDGFNIAADRKEKRNDNKKIWKNQTGKS